MTRRALRLFLALMVASSTTACLFYDSRWGESTKSQQRVAEQRLPEELSSVGGDASTTPAPECSIELGMRVYDASTVGIGAVRGGLDEVVAGANQVLAADSACLTVSEVRPRKRANRTAPLAEQLAELRALDAGGDVDLVVGLSSPTELLTFSFSQLGVAEMLGKHLVLRSASDARELEAIETAFPDLDAEARRQLYAKRKLHKATALLLHELGHALGAIHTTRRDELMYPTYNTDMKGFAEPTRALLRVSLEARRNASEPTASRSVATRMLRLLKSRPAGTWRQADLDARVRALEKMVAVRSEAGRAAGNASAVQEQKPVSGLTPSDQVAYLEATRMLEAKRANAARDRAKPLFDRYSDSYEVQELRCKIAMELSVAWENARAECEPLMRLTGASSAAGTAR